MLDTIIKRSIPALRQVEEKEKVQATDAKEVGVGNPAEGNDLPPGPKTISDASL